MCLTLSQTERTARRPHRCIWCCQAIGRGERYLDHRALNDEGGCYHFAAHEQERPPVRGEDPCDCSGSEKEPITSAPAAAP